MEDNRALTLFDPPARRRGLKLQSQHEMMLACALGVVILLTIAIFSFKPVLAVVPVAVIGIVLLWMATRYTTAHPQWLMLPIILVELVTAASFFPGESRAGFHYGLTALFCLPLLPAAWRNRTFKRDGFGLYLCYFMWAAVTITYSLAPQYSAARLLDALLIFCAVSFVVSQIQQPRQIPAVLIPLLIGCAVITGVVVFSAVALPRSMTWVLPGTVGAEDVDVPRFCAIFSGPNDVGALTLITVGSAAALWPAIRGKWRLMLTLLIVMSLATAALADSRTPIIALAVGATCYALWKYRGRAVVVLLLLAMMAGLMRFRPDSGGYLARGNVTTLTGRTDVWEFAISQVKQSPVLGHGYDVAGAILQSRYFPIWWGPWDEGPHTSLHDGYIDRAVAVGIPALIFWLFVVLRPWSAAIRRSDDDWGLKRMFCWMVIPMLIHNLAEVSISDCTGMVGVTFFLVWAMAERARAINLEQDQVEREAQHASLPPAAAALSAGALVAVALLAMPGTGRAQSNYHFPTLPPRAALPSGAKCAAVVRQGSSFEPRPANAAANHRAPTFTELALLHLSPLKSNSTPIWDFVRVDGNFSGTTDQILRWGACKWGIDEDVVRAEAVAESHWHQDDVGDLTSDKSLCPPGSGFPGAWNGTSCQQSYGIMQMKYSNFGGWPLSRDSTAFNVDFRLAYQRACMNGDVHYLGDQAPAGAYPRYPGGTTDQMLWGCMGDWFSGSWYDAGALKYIAEVKEDLAERPWSRSGF